MRICLVTREFPPLTPHSGGIGRQLRGLAAGLTGQGHEVVVLIVGFPASYHQTCDGATVVGTGRPSVGGPESTMSFGATLAVRRALDRLRPLDLVYAPEWKGDAKLAIGPGRPPVVTSLHMGLSLVRAVTQDARRLGDLRPHRVRQVWRERHQAEGSQAILAPSRAVLARTRALWDIERLPTAVVPNCLDVTAVREMARGEPPEGFPSTGPTVSFSGRLESRKGVHVLAAAMRRVWEVVPDAWLVLLGGDSVWRGRSMADYVREQAGARRSRVRVLGSQPPERLFPAIAQSTLVAVPSLWEAFGLVALEAMVLGRPLIATTGSGYDDFVTTGTNGLLVAPGETEPLAHAIESLLLDPRRAAALGSAASAASDAFDVRPIAARHGRFFEEVISGVRGESAPV